MNTAVTECARCSGKAGAHYGFCFIAQLWERVLGPAFPWAAPAPEEDIPLPPEPDFLDQPDDPDDWLTWVNEQADEDWPPSRPTGIPGDPPDPDGVFEDYLVLSGHVESDANWLPNGLTSIEVANGPQAEPADARLHSVEAVTELPDGYLDNLCEQLTLPEPKARARDSYNVQGLDLVRQQKREAAEDAAVQFVYDCTDTVPGGRVKLNDLHARYLEWHEVNDRPYISKEYLRELLAEMGLESKPGRMPGDSTAGRPPLLVHGVTFRQEVVMPQQPKVVVKAEPEKRTKHALLGAKPGRELPQMWQELIEPLLTEQGWRYEPCNGNGRGKPRLITPDGKTVTLPSTPHPSGRTLQNTRSFLKQNGALL